MLSMENVVTEILPGKVDDSTAREVYRSLQVLHGTVTGEQALDRELEIDGSIVDYLQKSAQVLLVAKYVHKTERYESRAKVVRVEWTGRKAQDGTTTPKVVIEIV